MELDLSDVELETGTIHIGCLRDISERQSYTEALQHQALHDNLTGLPNRVLFGDRVTHAIRAALRTGDSLALLVMDLDDFKQVNDTLGHQHGDALLKLVTERLVGCLRDGDTVARLGGDEFGILPAAATDLAGAATVVWTIQQALEPTFLVDGHVIDVKASIGITLVPAPRRQRRRPAPPGRPRDVRRQAGRHGLRAVRRRAGGDPGAPPRPARRAPPVHRACRAGPALPAEDRPRAPARSSASRR